MLRKLKLPFLIAATLIVTTFLFYIISTSEALTITQKKDVVYELPFPGLLPDHPLYVFKRMRDGVLDFVTQDNTKKAELYFKFSDKDTNMAVYLMQKGKNNLALNKLVDGEKYALKIFPLLSEAKKQGSGPTQEFKDKLKLSNTKHREIMEKLLEEAPQGDKKKLLEAIALNEEVKLEIEKIDNRK